jgi:hypothetical protein
MYNIRYSRQILMKLEFSGQFFSKNPQISIFVFFLFCFLDRAFFNYEENNQQNALI